MTIEEILQTHTNCSATWCREGDKQSSVECDAVYNLRCALNVLKPTPTPTPATSAAAPVARPIGDDDYDAYGRIVGEVAVNHLQVLGRRFGWTESDCAVALLAAEQAIREEYNLMMEAIER